MEWLKKLIGEENFAKLTDETIGILKTGLGDVEYIPNDPTKIIPKAVFNGKLEEIKHLKGQITSYESELENRKDMITTTDHKAKLIEAENNFKLKLVEAENQYKSQMALSEKKTLCSNLLAANDAKYVDLLINQIDMENVVVKDGKILNSDDIIKPLKSTYTDAFKVASGVTPPIGNPTPPPVGDKEALIQKYNEAQKTNQFHVLPGLMRQIEALENKEKG